MRDRRAYGSNRAASIDPFSATNSAAGKLESFRASRSFPRRVAPRQTALAPDRGSKMVFVLPRFAITAALLTSAAHAQTEPSNGAEGCRCITAASWRALYTDESSGSPLLTATVESSDHMYPFDYGLGSCEQWDLSLEPACADADGTRLPAAPSWCERRWCWVDPASCDQLDVAETTYFPDADAHCVSRRRRHHQPLPPPPPPPPLPPPLLLLLLLGCRQKAPQLHVVVYYLRRGFSLCFW